MAIVQISKMQLRRGPSADLPGKPSSLSPLSFEDGLDPGELILTTDLGRIYVGMEPSEGQPNFERTEFPYQNVEVLTENSTDFIETLVNRLRRETGSASFFEAPLNVSTGEWTNVRLVIDGALDADYTLDATDPKTGSFEYTVFDGEGAVVRLGKLILSYTASSSEPSLTDLAYGIRRTDIIDVASATADEIFNPVEFRFVEAGPVSARYLAFQYRNPMGEAYSLQFRSTLPVA